MKKILTILAIFMVSAIYAQTPKKMVLIPDYVETYEYKFDQELEVDVYPNYQVPIRTEYYRRSNDIFIIGNFNEVNIIRPMIDLPKCTPQNNIYEYIKTTQFKPELTLSEILRK